MVKTNQGPLSYLDISEWLCSHWFTTVWTAARQPPKSIRATRVCHTPPLGAKQQSLLAKGMSVSPAFRKPGKPPSWNVTISHRNNHSNEGFNLFNAVISHQPTKNFAGHVFGVTFTTHYSVGWGRMVVKSSLWSTPPPTLKCITNGPPPKNILQVSNVYFKSHLFLGYIRWIWVGVRLDNPLFKPLLLGWFLVGGEKILKIRLYTLCWSSFKFYSLWTNEKIHHIRHLRHLKFCICFAFKDTSSCVSFCSRIPMPQFRHAVQGSPAKNKNEQILQEVVFLPTPCWKIGAQSKCTILFPSNFRGETWTQQFFDRT